MDQTLQAISLSDSDVDEDTTKTSKTAKTAKTGGASSLRGDQSEEQFQEQKSSWKPICYSDQPTPLPQSITTKDAVLALKAAAEARYFHRDYAGALALAGQALESPGASLEAGLVHRLERKELEALQEACRRRFASLNTV